MPVKETDSFPIRTHIKDPGGNFCVRGGGGKKRGKVHRTWQRPAGSERSYFAS